MDVGKLPPEMLQNKILDLLKPVRQDILVRSSVGQDSCIVDMEANTAVLSTDPITGIVDNMGWFAVHIACNDVAANGAEPVGVLLTVLLPPTIEGNEIDRIMVDAHRAANELKIEILGGHTEVTPVVNQPVISTTALGKGDKNYLVIPANVRPGQDIILTKGAGIEGTAILAKEKRQQLLECIDANTLDRAETFSEMLSVVPESKIALHIGVSAMHDVTEGGVLGALYEVAQTAQCGFEVIEEEIPVREETKLIAQVLRIDPFRLISSGAMLIYTDKGEEMVNALAEAGIRSHIIGRTTKELQFSLIKNGTIREVEPPRSDELWRVL